VRQVTITPKTVTFAVAFFLVFYSGFVVGQTNAERGGDKSGGVVVNENQGKPASVDFGLFWDAWRIVEDKYVKTPDNQERVYGAIAGMVAGLGDPFSVYMKPAETSRFNEDISGNFEGIGAELIQKEGLITVVAPLEDSPAQKAGVMAGDIIIKIDGKDAPQSLDEAVKQIRGTKGTQVKLTIVRSGKQEEITITRDRVEVKSVTYTKKDTMGIIKLNQFTGNTTELLDQAIAQSQKDNVKGIVLDMRNNPGGLLDVAVEVTSRFMNSGTVVIERDKDKKETELKTVGTKVKVTVPVILLVNQGSASASEIVAGALQDVNRAKVLGETTFGKGSVQSVERLKDGSAIRITIAEWLTPKKREINKQGIKPDIEVKLSEDDVKNKRDPQLDKALELLKAGG
jgi:carboxyl-terminal processing protease